MTIVFLVTDHWAGGPGWGIWNWNVRAKCGINPTPPEKLQLQSGAITAGGRLPETRGCAPVLTEVLVRKVSNTNSVAPVKASVEDIAGGGLDARAREP